MGERIGEAKDRALGAAHDATERIVDGAHATKERATDAAHAAKDRLHGTIDRAADSARATRERLRDTAHSARMRAGELRDSARHQVDRARGGYDRMLREQPLALGAIGLALGAVIAAALPRTREEDRAMGAARDRLADEATDAAREQIGKARHVAEAARDAAQAEWREPDEHRDAPPATPEGFPPPEPVAPSVGRSVPGAPH
jgi:hypothetical protein